MTKRSEEFDNSLDEEELESKYVPLKEKKRQLVKKIKKTTTGIDLKI